MTVSGETLRAISTPERVHSRLGTLDYVDGFPIPATNSFFDKTWRPSEIEPLG